MTPKQQQAYDKCDRIVTELEKHGIQFHGIDNGMVLLTCEGKKLYNNIMTWQEFPEEEIIKNVLKSFK
jgi:predicted transcriptional regulator